MIQCRRLGYAVLSSSRMDELISYFEDVIGLFLTHREEGHAILSTRQGLECVVLEHGAPAELVGLSFEISPRTSLEEARAALAERG